jgi:hypothetical protein
MLKGTRTSLFALVTGCALAAGCASSAASRNTSATASTRQRSPAVAQNDNTAVTRTSYQPAEVIVREGMELQWAVQSPTAPANRSMGGKVMVGPDGSIELGPYGSVHVAGLTGQQAKTAVANHLANYVPDAQVTLVPVALVTRTPAEQSDRYSVSQTAWHPYQPAPEVTETTPAEVQQTSGPLRRFGQRVAEYWKD